MRIAIVVPVYNEAQNIELLVQKINSISNEYAIIIVDDDSRDGTQEILANLAKKFKVSHHVRKNERGYGSALIHGFNKAKDYDIIVTMDADLSHDPSVIPLMIEAVEKGSDVVIGSRYVNGGKIADWPLFRRIASKLTNVFVSIFLNTRIKDNTSGYRAYSGPALNKLLNKLKSSGYYILEEILFWVNQENLNVKEIPIEFSDRKKGASKARLIKEATGLLMLVVNLRKKTLDIFYKFLAVGFMGIFVNEILLYVITEFGGIHYMISSLIAIEASILSNFFLNDVWSFRSRRTGNYFYRMFKFNVARIITSSLNYIALVVLTWFGLNYLVSNLVGICLATVMGFAFSIKWVWYRENDDSRA